MDAMEKQLLAELIELQGSGSWPRQYELDHGYACIWVLAIKKPVFISNRAATTTGKLADALKVTPTNVTGIIDRLLEKIW